MKNKKVVYLLLALSAVVWGGVFVRLYGVFLKDEAVSAKSFKKRTPTVYQSGKDTFELMVNYKDPFLKEVQLPIENPRKPFPFARLLLLQKIKSNR